MRKRKKFNPIFLIIFLSIFFGLGSLEDFLVDFIGYSIAIGLLLAIPAAIVFLIIKLVKSIKGSTEYAKSYTTVSSEQVLDALQQHFKNNKQLHVDETTYIEFSGNDSTSINSYDIYMNDEYVSSLGEFMKAFPNGFNSLSKIITKLVKVNKKESRKEKKNKKNDESINQKIEDIKNEIKESECERYINIFAQLNHDIPNEQISDGLNDTVVYLKQIDICEKEFSESKDKTTKLYQYYLPMLKDILENYIRLNKNASFDSEFKASEDRLIKTIVLINGALKTISSSLVEDYYTDMKVDMKTLESILKKDGLIDELHNVSSGGEN